MPNVTPHSKRNNVEYQAMDILSRRDHAEKELVDKLKRKGFAGDDITSVVTQLKQKGFVNDANFARIYTESILRGKPVGPRWIQAKLTQKGIARDVSDSVIAEIYGGGAEERVLQKAAKRWQHSHGRYAQDFQRLARFLASRGFSPSKIRLVLDQDSLTPLDEDA